MGTYLTEGDTHWHQGASVSCRIKGKFIGHAQLIICDWVTYIYQDIFDGDNPDFILMRPNYKYSWRWDDEVTEVQLINGKGETIVNETPDILEELKLVGLDEKVRILRKYGLVDGDGQPTEKGQKAIWPLLFALVSDKLVENIKAAEKLRKANKKSKKEE